MRKIFLSAFIVLFLQAPSQAARADGGATFWFSVPFGGHVYFDDYRYKRYYPPRRFFHHAPPRRHWYYNTPPRRYGYGPPRFKHKFDHPRFERRHYRFDKRRHDRYSRHDRNFRHDRYRKRGWAR